MVSFASLPQTSARGRSPPNKHHDDPFKTNETEDRPNSKTLSDYFFGFLKKKKNKK